MIRNFFRKTEEDTAGPGIPSAGAGDRDPNEAAIVDIADAAQDPDTDAIPGESEEEDSAIAEMMAAQTQLKTRLLRLQADFDNYKKRNAAARAEARADTRRELLLTLLPVYDNFLRALQHAEEQEDYSGLRTGVEGIRQQLDEFFRRHGLEEISAESGEEFDPNLHDALGTVAGPEDNHHTIAHVVLKGFRMGDTVVRPAQVMVYQAADA